MAPGATIAEVKPHVRAHRLLTARVDCLLCRAAAVLARVAAHPHAPPFSSPVDVRVFPDYLLRVPRPMDLRTCAEKLARGLYKFGVSGDEPEAAASVRRDVLSIWSNARAYNTPRSTVVRMLIDIEADFAAAWEVWVMRRDDGWLPWITNSAATLVPMPAGGRLPAMCTEMRPFEVQPVKSGRRPKRHFVPPPPPELTPEQVAALSPEERHSLLERSLPNRAPPPPGWDADDVGGVPWHLREEFATPAAIAARHKAESSMREVIAETKRVKAQAMEQAEAAASGSRIVTAAVGRRVICTPKGNSSSEAREAHGVYQVDGRVLEDESNRALSVADFVAIAGHTSAKRPLKAIVLASSATSEDEGTSLEQLLQMHGSIDVAARAANAQADPHCTLCGGGESIEGNEILLCDGQHCVGCYHQKCCTPPVTEVPEGSWLCSTCVANGNIVDPEVLEDERKAEECAGGEESTVVLCNDGVGNQDIELLMEVVDVIDSSLPLIGRTNAAKLVFAPDHQSLVLLRSTATARRVLGSIVLKPHKARGFLEVAFCVVRKEEQRNGVGSRLIGMLKEHAFRNLQILHLLTYADDSATGFFERLGFDAEHTAGMPLNRFHWGISHYIGSQLRQCVLDPDGATLYSHGHAKKVPAYGRRLWPPKPAAAATDAEGEAAATEAASAGGGAGEAAAGEAAAAADSAASMEMEG